MNAGPESPEATSREQQAMLRALDVASSGPARGVNPQVGCVILDADGAIIAEGWHRGAGTPHAEVDALSQLPPGAAQGTTAVVTLEPCNHTGRTGPCAVALLDAGVARVVYAVTDPGRHSGGGAARLRDGSVSVVGGVLADQAEAFLGDWLTTARLGRPLVTVKWASTLDGRIAAADGTSRWITGPEARADVHRRRAEHDAVLVGTGTVLADDPSLTARDADGELLPAQPVPVVMGERAIPDDAVVHRHPLPVIVHQGHDPAAVLAELRAAGIRSVFIEGGPTIASAFLRAGLADTVLTYLAPVLLGGPRLAIDDLGIGTIADALRLDPVSVERLGADVLIVSTPTTARADDDADAHGPIA